jgi:transcriptional regulator with XRE-family HTH domain
MPLHERGYLPDPAGRVRRLREALSAKRVRRVRQRDLAEMLGVMPLTVAAWERGAHRPSWEHWERIVALEATVAALVVDAARLQAAREEFRLKEMLRRSRGTRARWKDAMTRMGRGDCRSAADMPLGEP